MKIKVLTVFSLAVFLFMVGCKGAANTNVANTNSMTNSNSMANSMTNTMTAPAMDSAAKSAVESALTKAGITGVTVDATTASVTLRGSVAKGKMAEAVKIANETGKRRVDNQLTEK